MSEPHAEPTSAEADPFADEGPGDVDRQTLLWAMAGDDRAFARLVKHYDLSLRSLVHPQVGRADLMDKVLVSTYLQAYRALHRLKGAPDPGPWLSAIAAKACAAELRRETQRTRVAERRHSGGARPAGRPVDLSAALDPGRAHSSDASVAAGQPRPVAAALGPEADGGVRPQGAADLAAPAESAESVESEAGTATAETVDGATDPEDRSQEAQPPPAHHPEFWNRLGRRLLAEREIPARPAPPVERMVASRPPVIAEGFSHGVAAKVAAPASVGELAQQARVPSGGKRRAKLARNLAVIAAVLVVLGGLLYAALLIGGSARPINRSGMTTGRLADKVTTNLDQSRFVNATFTHIELAAPSTVSSLQVTWSRDGSFRLKGINTPVDSSYDAATGTSRQSTTTTGPDGLQARQVEFTGLAGGPPDPHAAMDPFFDHDLPAVLRAMSAAPNGTVSSTTVQGRAVWQAEVVLVPNRTATSDAEPVRAQLRIDQRLLVPLELTVSSKVRALRTYTLSNIALDQPPSLDAFNVPFGPGPVERTNARFARGTLSSLSARLPGTRPATPTYLPDGFELAEVAFLAGQGDRTGAQGQNPPSEDVVSLTYRRGWDRVTVTTRANKAGPASRWSDPFVTPVPAPASASASASLRINGGRFRLAQAQQVTPATGEPYLWGVANEVVFTVSGALSPADLVKVTESIQP